MVCIRMCRGGSAKVYMAGVAVCWSVLIALAYALPPFEIRSASSQKSEGATAWINRLQRVRGETPSDGGIRLSAT